MEGFDPITLIAQLAFGFAVKHWPVLKAWPNKLIPAFNLGLAILIQLAGPAIAHAQDGATSSVAHPGWWAVWCFLKPAILNTLASTGIFSTTKNLIQHSQKAAA